MSYHSLVRSLKKFRNLTCSTVDSGIGMSDTPGRSVESKPPPNVSMGAMPAILPNPTTHKYLMVREKLYYLRISFSLSF